MMNMKRIVLMGLAVVLLAAPALAAKKHEQRGSLSELQSRAQRIIRHVERAKTTIRWFERHHHGKTISWLQAHPRALADVNVARQRVILGRAELGRVRALLERRRAVAAARARQRAHLDRPSHYDQWLCIYSHENGGYGWGANTGNGYYGGLQMDREFQRTYGNSLYESKGTADHWTPIEQMWVAERAWKTRGFWPWPNTARYCGLL